MLLSELSSGQRAQILDMAALTRPIRRKLMCMGLLPHSEIEFLRQAPMGDPLQIRASGITLAVQRSLASQIQVEVVE
ncbi:FeoA family protein [Dongshaea marina]|uniref:FeoA family protein n=1 Tax=Dongshaea marina TaxID=2047966 RepID=UPI000D3E42C3|nr:FeoA family protein [Dongshaea marina]